MICPHCAFPQSVFQWQKISDGRRHIRATCRGRFIKYVNQNPESMKAADANPEWSERLPDPREQGRLF